MDYAMLSRLQINSSSDQGDYRKYPSITVGSTPAVLLEQSGIWSYPQKSSTSDQVSFNMVNAMLCRIQQSGDLANVTEPSFAQVRAGIRIYKDVIRPHIPKSIPFYPLGMPDMVDSMAPVCLGIKASNATFVAVWRLAGGESVRIPISAKNLKLVYPSDLGIQVDTSVSALTVTFPRKYMACILSVDSH
jgi:alpha-galactosidase